MHYRHAIEHRDTRLQMSAMIDIVFLLLIFFVMTFQIVVLESNLPVAAPAAGDPGMAALQLPHIVRLDATAEGDLAGVRLNDEPVADLSQLREHARGLVEQSSAADLEFVVECDQRLNYRHAVDALTAVSGYVGDDGRVVPLVRNVRFAQPRGL